MTTTASTRGKGRTVLETALRNRTAFRTSGALKGIVVRPDDFSISAGRLTSPFDVMFREDQRLGRISYVVLSYQTPIAWVRTDGRVEHVDQRFSVTTSNHQALVAAHL